ncbi:hypothetical protein DDZ16_18130 [Marinilabilia rubra]|uniref:Uncharacterized protein n=1 Tax=Marinilabilia rubra TaxID=2162893 RepID=A0A2U2B4J6_9BACT|nr:hypothetical protein DDZ16_18130 [Marinilabilia rubra]
MSNNSGRICDKRHSYLHKRLIFCEERPPLVPPKEEERASPNPSKGGELVALLFYLFLLRGRELFNCN